MVKGLSLSYDEYTTLERIAKRTKLDTWFGIRQKNGLDYAYDVESGNFVSWRKSMITFNEAIFSDSFKNEEEKSTYYKFLAKLNILHNPNYC